MSIEAMKQVVKEAVYHRGGYWIIPEKDFSSLRQAIADFEKQEPHSWYSAQEDEWMTNKIRKEHERLNSYTHKVGKFDLALYTHPQPKRESISDAHLYLESLVEALDGAFISSWQSTHAWKTQLDEARDYLADHGIKENA